MQQAWTPRLQVAAQELLQKQVRLLGKVIFRNLFVCVVCIARDTAWCEWSGNCAGQSFLRTHAALKPAHAGERAHTSSRTLLFCRTHRVMISSSSDKVTCEQWQTLQGGMASWVGAAAARGAIVGRQRIIRPRDSCRLPLPCRAQCQKTALLAKSLSPPATGYRRRRRAGR